jgi:hypothetical protein
MVSTLRSFQGLSVLIREVLYLLHAGGQRASDGAVGQDDDGARGAPHPAGLGNLRVLLNHDVPQPVLVGLGAVLLRLALADQGDGEPFGALALPAAHLGQERLAGAAVRVREDEQGRLA